MARNSYYMQRMRNIRKRCGCYVPCEQTPFERFTTWLLKAFLWVAGIAVTLIYVVPAILIIRWVIQFIVWVFLIFA